MKKIMLLFAALMFFGCSNSVENKPIENKPVENKPIEKKEACSKLVDKFISKLEEMEGWETPRR